MRLDSIKDTSSCPLLVGPMIVELSPKCIGDSVTAQEEIFGPILAVTPFDDEEEMLSHVNGTPYALTTGVFT